MFDRFDVCAAYYIFATNWHSGQSSDIYKIFGRLAKLRYSPSLRIRNGKLINENQRRIYRELVAKFVFQVENTEYNRS